MQKINCHFADTFWQRFIGLAWQKKIPSKPLFISNCRSIHTFGMQFPLNLLWLDSNMQVICINKKIGSNQIKYCLQAKHVLEYSSTIPINAKVGDRLKINQQDFVSVVKIPSKNIPTKNIFF